ncbi:hypothetical protein H4217_009145 [Coemansia sp. RSA 1939]|nr:hypothetical protein H4217_009145 [Coemansia sp. RSA 1939]KAJ2588573.1 hypothetical protein EV177_009397 [Coemansia sp. RSA 1804]
MLSSKELQEELALWSNAQFQLEPVNEDHSDVTKHTSLSPGEFNQHGLHGGAAMSSAANTLVSPSIPADTWNFMSLAQSQGGGRVQLPTQSTTPADSLDFIVGNSTSAAEFLNSIAIQGNASSQHGFSNQQGQQSAAMLNGVDMLPMLTLPHHQQQQQQQQQQQKHKQQTNTASAALSSNTSLDGTRRQPKHTAIAPAPASSHQFNQPSILPKGGVFSDMFERVSSGGQSARVSPKPKPAVAPTVAAPATSSAGKTAGAQRDGSVDSAENKQDESDDEGRQSSAVADKRRRNTAASARFRIKKKMKEQALEHTAREMTAKAEALEKRVQELEMETRWLKSLITEKDPNALDKIHCPCHHPNGFEAADPAKMQPLHSSSGRQQQLAIAPTSASDEPSLKKARRV